MKTLEHTIEISAPVDRVWAMTLDVESWPEFSPTMTTIERLETGPIAVGSTARVKQPGQGAKIWTVSALDEERTFAWQTKFMGTTMTGGHHLAPTTTGTQQRLTIDIDGPLASVVGALLGRPLRKAIAAENKGFAAAAEPGATT